MKLITDNPIAVDSADHQYPRGAMQDNTHCPKFVHACKRAFKHPSLLDLGCAGGGLIRDFIDAGLVAVGLEGCDYLLRNHAGEWGNTSLLCNLLTVDITKPFTLTRDGRTAFQFDVISAWEVLEHIHECDLPQLFSNIKEHLELEGIFVASVATYPDENQNAKYHVTIKPREWWEQQLAKNGLRPIPNTFFQHEEFPRGSGNPLALGDWNARNNPEMGFHIVAEAMP